MSSIAVQRSLPAALVYEVLAHLDLGRDAASLFDPGKPSRPWAAALRQAYDRAPGRLCVHAIGLGVGDVDALLTLLRSEAMPALRDGAGRDLARALVGALEAERAAVEHAFTADAEAFELRRSRFQGDAVPVLARLRAALAETTGEPPPLRILDCSALGPHGRATTASGMRIVAVSLREPLEHALVQVLHEEIHPVTDPVVLDDCERVGRDTRAGSDGFAIHRRMELAAIEVGEALVAARAPELTPAYRRWRARLGV